VGQYQKGKTNLVFTLDYTEARDSEWQWHQLGHMQICTLLQTDNHASTPPLSFFSGQMPFLPPNQQRQSTEGLRLTCIMAIKQWSGQHIRILCSYDLLNVRHLTLYLYAFVLQLRLKLLAIILQSFFTLL